MYIKPSYMSHAAFDNNLVTMHKSKPTLKLNMCISDLIKVLMYKFHYDFMKNIHGSYSVW